MGSSRLRVSIGLEVTAVVVTIVIELYPIVIIPRSGIVSRKTTVRPGSQRLNDSPNKIDEPFHFCSGSLEPSQQRAGFDEGAVRLSGIDSAAISAVPVACCSIRSVLFSELFCALNSSAQATLGTYQNTTNLYQNPTQAESNLWPCANSCGAQPK